MIYVLELKIFRQYFIVFALEKKKKVFVKFQMTHYKLFYWFKWTRNENNARFQ